MSLGIHYEISKKIREDFVADKIAIHSTLHGSTIYIFTIIVGRVEIVYYLEYFHNCVKEELHEIILTGFIDQVLVDSYTGTLKWAYEVILNRIKIEDGKRD